jgi:hypothetical protein
VGELTTKIVIFNIINKEELFRLDGHSSPAFWCCITLDEKYCITRSDNETIVWDISMGEPTDNKIKGI